MKAIIRLCFSLRKSSHLLIIVVFATCTLMYYNVCSVVLEDAIFPSSRIRADTAYTKICLFSPRSTKSQTTSGSARPQELNLPPENGTTCSNTLPQLNWTLCPECFRPVVPQLANILREIEYQDYLLPDTPRDYFKIKPQNVTTLITDYLISPSLDCPYLLAVQPSLLLRRQDRDTVRSTWGSAARQQTWPNRRINAGVKVLFVVARQILSEKNNSAVATEGGAVNSNARQFEEIAREASQYNDILYLDMIDSYMNLTLKLLSAFKWVKDKCPCVKFILKVDYDTFVNVPLLVDTLLYFEDRFSFSIIGTIYTTGLWAKRSGKWAVPTSVYPMQRFPEYSSGCGYILSYKVLSEIVDTVVHVPLFSIEDAFITGVMRRVTGCKLFNILRRFTHYSDKHWYLCDMHKDKKILGMNMDGQEHQIIWRSFVTGNCT